MTVPVRICYASVSDVMSLSCVSGLAPSKHILPLLKENMFSRVVFENIVLLGVNGTSCSDRNGIGCESCSKEANLKD